MIELPPHPIFRLPPREKVLALEAAVGREQAAARLTALVREFHRRIILEKERPLEHGYIPPIWRVSDELLQDGKEVVLADPDWDPRDPELQKIRPPDFIAEAMRRRETGEGKLVVMGARELLVTGANRSSKSQYGGKKCIDVATFIEEGRGWSFADSESISIARQQPILYRYLPFEVKEKIDSSAAGSFKQGTTTKIGYTQAGGFRGQSFVMPNRAQHWFKNFKQSMADMEGDQLDIIWLDELRDPELLKTLRVRLGDRDGLMLVTFTSIDDNYVTILQEYLKGAKKILEVDAELLPLKDKKSGAIIPGKFEKVPRVMVAGPGSDGNQRANILYFHITDNPYYGYTGKAKPGEKPIFGKERFYRMWRGASRQKILSRVYGVLVRTRLQQFNFDRNVHVVSRERVEAIMRGHLDANLYHLVDPCSGRNWFMGWSCHWAPKKVLIYREWPSTGHPRAYIPGIGDPGPWALPGKPHDGVPGPAQTPFRLGLRDYKREILRLEGRREVGIKKEELRSEPVIDDSDEAFLARAARAGLPKPLPKPQRVTELRDRSEDDPEEITERWIDSRYANSPKEEREGSVTLLEQMEELEMEFRAMTSEKNILAANDGSIDMINSALAFDPEVPIGKWSRNLAKINEPDLLISEDCPNVIYALENWTGLDGQKGACKDPVDILRGLFLSELEYIGKDAYAWQGASGGY